MAAKNNRNPDPIVVGTRKLKQALKRSRGCVRGKKGPAALADGVVSLKQYIKQNLESFDDELKTLAHDWLSNKQSNPSSPPMGIGRTNGKKKNKGGGGTAAPAKG